MKKSSKYFGTVFIIYLLVIVIETLWELFHVSRTESTKLTTILGITINNKISKHEISTTFGLTTRVLIIYIFLLVIVYTIVFIARKNKK